METDQVQGRFNQINTYLKKKMEDTTAAVFTSLVSEFYFLACDEARQKQSQLSQISVFYATRYQVSNSNSGYTKYSKMRNAA